jgi:DNA primase
MHLTMQAKYNLVMQTMLNKLRTYAEKRGLTVNTAKSEVVHFNSKSVSPLQNSFTYYQIKLRSLQSTRFSTSTDMAAQLRC